MVQMVHPEGLSHKGTKPCCADRVLAIPLARLVSMIDTSVLGATRLLGYQKDVMDVKLMAYYIESQTRELSA
jgi:hypothetical protein